LWARSLTVDRTHSKTRISLRLREMSSVPLLDTCAALIALPPLSPLGSADRRREMTSTREGSFRRGHGGGGEQCVARLREREGSRVRNTWLSRERHPIVLGEEPSLPATGNPIRTAPGMCDGGWTFDGVRGGQAWPHRRPDQSRALAPPAAHRDYPCRTPALARRLEGGCLVMHGSSCVRRLTLRFSDR